MQLRRPTLIGLAFLGALAACGGGDGPSAPAPTPGIEVLSGASQSGPAGTVLGKAIIVRVRDADGKIVPSKPVVFKVVQGDATLQDTVAVTGTDGIATAPALTLGKSAGYYAITASYGAYNARIEAAAASSYALDVRFFGSAVAADQQQLFTNAAARIRGIVTGSVPPVNVPNQDIAQLCGAKGVPVMNEIVNGMVLFAAVDSIDGKGKTLAQAGGCLIRKYTIGKDTVFLPLVGIMTFDRDDWPTMVAQGNLQSVITHEMLHLVGVGRSTWAPKGLLINEGTTTVAFTGARAMQACNDAHGTSFCVSGVPVENTGGTGTAGTHWRKTTFGPELMTGYADKCPAPPAACTYPLSAITIGALQDVGYSVNFAAADSYNVPANATARLIPAENVEWERERPGTVYELLPDGRVRPVKPQ